MARKLERIRRELAADVIVACDEEGRVISSVPPSPNETASSLPVGTALAALPAVKRALDPNAAPGDEGQGALSVLRLGPAYFQVAVAPVVLDGFTLGALLVGRRLDVRYLASLRDSFDGEVVIASDGRIVVSSLGSAAPSALIAAIATAGRPTHTAKIGDDDFVIATIPLGETADGARVELHLLQAMTPVIRALTATLIPKFVIYGSIAVLVGLFGALVIACTQIQALGRFRWRHLRGRSRANASGRCP